LHGLFTIFSLLLQYHAPALSVLFKTAEVTADIFLTSWLLTIFASKTKDLETLFSLWKEVLKENDRLILCYISVAVLIHFQDALEAESEEMLPKAVLSLRITSLEEVESIVKLARTMKNNMPYSINEKLRRYDVFKLELIDSILSTLRKETCLSVHARDVLQLSYPEAHLCQTCVKGKCSCFNRSSALEFIVIDCRRKEEQRAGALRNSVLLPARAYNDTEFLRGLPYQFSSIKDRVHICLMGNEAFKVFDNEKKADFTQNMVQNLLELFLLTQFPYVSIVEGGYLKVHEFAMHYGVDLENHSSSICEVCDLTGKNSKSISQGFKKIKDQLVGKVKAFSSAVRRFGRSETTDLNIVERNLPSKMGLRRQFSTDSLF
jgi:hypothetical protein